MYSYHSHNPNVFLIDAVEGTEKDEYNLHFNLCGLQYRNEWFHKDPKVLEIWNEYKKEHPSNDLMKTIIKKYIKSQDYLVPYYQKEEYNEKDILDDHEERITELEEETKRLRIELEEVKTLQRELFSRIQRLENINTN